MRDSDLQPAMRPSIGEPIELLRDGARFVIGIELTNPTEYPFAIRQIDYQLTHRGIGFLSGFSAVDDELAPGETLSFTVPIVIRTDAVLDHCPDAHTRIGDQITGRADLRLHLSVGDETDLVLPGTVEFVMPLPLPPLLEIERLEFDTLGWNHASGQLVLGVTNRCMFDLDVVSASLHIQIGPSVKLHTNRVLDLALAPAGRQIVRVPLSFSPANIGYNAFSALNSDAANYLLQADLSASTPWGPAELVCEQRGRARVVSPGDSDADNVSRDVSNASDTPTSTG